MVNKNYIKGRNKEYKVANILKSLGYEIAQRTAGSHSPFDIIAICTKNKKLKLIQVKSGKFSKNEKAEEYNKYRHLTGTYDVQFKVWTDET